MQCGLAAALVSLSAATIGSSPNPFFCAQQVLDPLEHRQRLCIRKALSLVQRDATCCSEIARFLGSAMGIAIANRKNRCDFGALRAARRVVYTSQPGEFITGVFLAILKLFP